MLYKCGYDLIEAFLHAEEGESTYSPYELTEIDYE